jgi:hypothetical protein
MSAILGTSVTGAGGASVYSVSNSLRFRASASAYLNKTFGSAGNRKTWTWSFWLKRSSFSESALFNSYSAQNDSGFMQFGFVNSGAFELRVWSAPLLTTTAVFRDPSAWYHVVLAFDTTQATSSNRVRIYVNGVEQALTGTYPTLNADYAINQAATHLIAARTYGPIDQFSDCYLAETHFVNAQQLTPSSFGETNASTGVWQPKAYAGTYGTNGFYLKFSNIATTSGSNTGLGQDFSGNGNFFNTNNISVTAGVTYDAMTDSPTPTSSTVGNYCTLNPLFFTSSGAGTLSNGNLNFQQSAGVVFGNTFGTVGLPPIGTAGKYYFECVFTSGILTDINQGVGIANAANTGDYAGMWPKSSSSITIRSDSQTATGVAYSYNTVVQVAVDCATGSIWFGFNNTWVSGDPSSGTSPTYSNLTSGAVYVPLISTYSYSTSGFINFGQRPFAYTPPSGFNRLQTFNLPTPTIGASATTLANKYFDATLYTGNGSSQSVTNSGSMQPDFVWIKSRSNSSFHHLVDVVRGTNSTLYSNSDEAQSADTNVITAFNSNGFSVGSNAGVNGNARTYVGWQWDAGTSTVTNTSGSISAQVRASTTAGFSVVTYTGTGSAATIGHGLGISPRMIIVKRRNSSGNWAVFHSNAGNEAVAFLNSNAAFSSPETTYWNATSPTSTVFSVGTNSAVNASGGTYVAYVFAQVSGYSSIGRYTGNGSTDGPFVYTGFRPRYIMIKNRDSTGAWMVSDTARFPINVVNGAIEAQSSAAEFTGDSFYQYDILSNGFKIRGVSSAINSNGGAYMYIAFAESPFNYSLAR